MKQRPIDEQTLVNVVRSADVPLTPKRAALAAYRSASADSVEHVHQALVRLDRAHEVYEYPPERRGRAVRYGSVTPLQWVRRRILDRVEQGGGKVTEKQVRGHLHAWERRLYDHAVGGLINDGRLHRLTVRYRYLVTFVPAPFDYLPDRHVSSLKEILERINKRRAKPLSLEELRSFLNDTAVSGPSATVTSGKPTEEMLRGWHKEDVPKLGGMTSVPIPWTWGHYAAWCGEHHYRPDLATFHELLRELAESGKIVLIPHSQPHEIAQYEADLILHGERGESLYYWRWR
jgi:hypothetical protein